MLTSCLTKEEGEGEAATRKKRDQTGPGHARAASGSPGQDAHSWQAHFKLLNFFFIIIINSFFFSACHISPSLSYSPSERRLQLALSSSPPCQCCHLFHHLFSFSLHFSPLRCEPQHSCTHWNPLGCPSDPVLPATRTVPEPWQKSHNTLHFQTTSTAAAPSTLEGSPSPSDSTLTALNVGIPILHSTHPLYGGALPPPQSCPVDTGCHSPPPSRNHSFLG